MSDFVWAAKMLQERVRHAEKSACTNRTALTRIVANQMGIEYNSAGGLRVLEGNGKYNQYRVSISQRDDRIVRFVGTYIVGGNGLKADRATSIALSFHRKIQELFCPQDLKHGYYTAEAKSFQY